MMRRGLVCLLTLIMIAVSLPAMAAQAPPEVATAAMKYAEALVKGDLAAAWQLLSSQSKTGMNAIQWEEEFRSLPAARPPAGNALLKALAQADPPATIGPVRIVKGESLIAVSGTVEITEQLVLVKEGTAWLVEAAASDELNVKQAAIDFMEAVRNDTGAAPTPRPVRTPTSSLPMLRVMLAPEAKDFHIADTVIQGNRATVTLSCKLPVSMVLRAVRSGPGWVVDLTRPMVSTNPTSPDPLKEAADAAMQTACQEQLRRLARGIQMYAAASAELLPDPDRWLDQIQPYLPEGATAHCPADTAAGVSYVMNRNLQGKKNSEIGNPATTILLYEAKAGGKNPADTGEAWPTPAVHATGNNVLYLDGSVRPGIAKPSFALGERPRPAATPPRPMGQTPPRARRPANQGQQQQPAP